MNSDNVLVEIDKGLYSNTSCISNAIQAVRKGVCAYLRHYLTIIG